MPRPAAFRFRWMNFPIRTRTVATRSLLVVFARRFCSAFDLRGAFFFGRPFAGVAPGRYPDPGCNAEIY